MTRDLVRTQIFKQEREQKLAILKTHFTQQDLEFVKGKIVQPLVGAPWVKPFKGCTQTKRVIVGNIILRIRAIRRNRTQILYHADWAPIEDPNNFDNYVRSFDEHFKAR